MTTFPYLAKVAQIFPGVQGKSMTEMPGNQKVAQKQERALGSQCAQE